MLGHHHHHHDNRTQQQLLSYVHDYLECVESLPLDIQRNVSLLREIDSKYQEVLKEVDEVFVRYQAEQDASQRKRLQLQLQRALIASQELGDEKIGVVTHMTELVENRSRQMDSHSLGLQEPGLAGGDTPDRPTSTATDRRSASNSSLLLPETPGSNETQRSSARRPRRQQRASDSRDSASSSSLALAPPSSGSLAADDPGGSGGDHLLGTSALASSSAAAAAGGSSSSSQPRSEQQKKSRSAKKKKRKSAKQERDDAASPPADLAVDPNEPTYCLCQQVSYGEMIGCDNEQCPIEWFHFSCVALTYKPKGKWFCPKCRGDNEKTMDKGLDKSRKERRSR